MKRALLVLAISACGDGKAKDVVETFEGTATYGGAPVAITACKAIPIRDKPATQLTLANGVTVIVSPLEGVLIGKRGAAPAKVECAQVGSHAHGGSNLRGGYWYQGTLDLACTHEGQPLTLDVTYDCGVKDRPSNRKPEPKP